MKNLKVMLTVLRACGVLPYVQDADGQCQRSRWLTIWSLLRLLLALTFFVLTFVPPFRRSYPQTGITLLGYIVVTYGICGVIVTVEVMLFLMSSRLAKIISKMAEVRMMCGRELPTRSKDPLYVAALAITIFLYVTNVVQYLMGSVPKWSKGENWVYKIPLVGFWLVAGMILPLFVYFVGTLLHHFQLLARATLPPSLRSPRRAPSEGSSWVQGPGILPVHRQSAPTFTTWPTRPHTTVNRHNLSSTISDVLVKEDFFHQTKILLLETDELVDSFLEYVGPLMGLWMATSVAGMTFSAYFLINSFYKVITISQRTVILLFTASLMSVLAFNKAADDINKQREECAKVYRRLLLLPDLQNLPVVKEVLATLERRYELKVLGLFNLGGSCTMTIFGFVLSYLVIALQFK